MVICNIFKNSMERTCPEGFMEGNRKVMFLSIHSSGKSLMTACLMIDTVSITVKKAGKLVTIDIPWEFHTAISSSFTM